MLRKRRFGTLPLALLLALLLAAAVPHVSAAQTLVAYQAQAPVKLDGKVSPGEWSDAQMINDSVSSMGVAFKHNATGLFILMQWPEMITSGLCTDQYCYGGVEFDNASNVGVMGTALNPAIMLLVSPSFKGGYDEFISQAETTPTSVETDGYKTQSTCALALSGTVYTAECYRPLHLTNASPHDPFLGLASGTSIEVGFAVGEFSEPGAPRGN